MIRQTSSELAAAIERSREACAALSAEDDSLKREVLTHAGNRWSLGVVHSLGVAGGPLRHSELAKQLEGVTQRMLTRTLRQLERDGLITRRDFGEVPPKVEYRLTPLGEEMLIGMVPLWDWVLKNTQAFHAARQRFEEAPLL